MGTPALDRRYLLGAELARGGFGAVYRATHLESGCEVALKVLHDHLADDDAMRERFRREAAALAQLRDPHIVTTYEHGELSDGRLFIAMELLHGEDLCTRLERVGRLSWQATIAIAREVGAALASAHARGIVHRDLKPANIHLERWSGGEVVKVLDFGIAKVLASGPQGDAEPLTRAGEVIGTVEYMAPEQLLGNEVDARADVFALGLVMYEMVAGMRPWGEIRSAAMYVATVMTRKPTPLSAWCTPSPTLAILEGIVMRCLAARPSDRYDSVVDVLEDLAAIDVRDPDEATQVVALPGDTLDRDHDDEVTTVSRVDMVAIRAIAQDAIPTPLIGMPRLALAPTQLYRAPRMPAPVRAARGSVAPMPALAMPVMLAPLPPTVEVAPLVNRPRWRIPTFVAIGVVLGLAIANLF